MGFRPARRQTRRGEIEVIDPRPRRPPRRWHGREYWGHSSPVSNGREDPRSVAPPVVAGVLWRDRATAGGSVVAGPHHCWRLGSWRDRARAGGSVVARPRHCWWRSSHERARMVARSALQPAGPRTTRRESATGSGGEPRQVAGAARRGLAAPRWAVRRSRAGGGSAAPAVGGPRARPKHLGPDSCQMFTTCTLGMVRVPDRPVRGWLCSQVP